jgi:thiamine pyrophosphokinase
LGDGRQQAWLIEGETLVEGEVGDFVSLLPIGGDAVGITTSGLEYALSDETIRLGSPRGVSNVLTQPRARITIRQGRALVVVVPMEAKGGFE